MRVSQHSSRQGSARHNDRDFDVSKSEHIDASRTDGNVTWQMSEYSDMSFAQAELAYYSAAYKAGLDARNTRYIGYGHAERCRSAEDLYRGEKTKPEELILQIGRHGDADGVTVDSFRACLDDYVDWLNAWNAEHGNPMQVLNWAIHTDEASVHCHLRRVWNAPDQDGNILPAQNKALERAGVPLPFPDKKEGRYNNRKMSFDAMAREKWQEIVIAHGFQIETEPISGDVRHLPIDDYRREQSAKVLEENQALKAENRELREEIERIKRIQQQKPEDIITRNSNAYAVELMKEDNPERFAGGVYQGKKWADRKAEKARNDRIKGIEKD